MKIENSINGRATLENLYNGIKISIPSKKNWFVIIFLTAWLLAWCIGEVFALSAVFGIKTLFEDADIIGGGVSVFMMLWLVGWTIGGFLALKTWLWMLFGKELIEIENNQMTIKRYGLLFHSAKKYDVDEISNLHLNENYSDDKFAQKKSNYTPTKNGIIKFDYGMKTIYFGAAIDEPEAKYLIDNIKSITNLK